MLSKCQLLRLLQQQSPVCVSDAEQGCRYRNISGRGQSSPGQVGQACFAMLCHVVFQPGISKLHAWYAMVHAYMQCAEFQHEHQIQVNGDPAQVNDAIVVCGSCSQCLCTSVCLVIAHPAACRKTAGLFLYSLCVTCLCCLSCRVGVEVATLQVRVDNLKIEADVAVGSRGNPSVTNTVRNMTEVGSAGNHCNLLIQPQ